MKNHHDLHIIFSIRHPVDTCMSKIIRGWIKDTSSDRTIEGAIVAMQHFHVIYKAMLVEFAKRTYGAKMENLILNPEKEISTIASFLNTKVTKKALEFYKYNRNKFHRKRYKYQIDVSQVDIHKRWEGAYNGFFSQRKNDIDNLKRRLKPMIQELGYGALA